MRRIADRAAPCNARGKSMNLSEGVMRGSRRSFLKIAAGAVALPAMPRVAWAQAYPTRPIKLVVAFPAGGPADTMGRLVGQAMSAKIGQPVVIENIGGAGGTIALKMMTTANPDGYTLLVNSGGPFCTASLLYKLDYEPVKTFIPTGTFAADSGVLVTGRALPVKTLAEFIRYAKANPGKLNSGASIGTNQHLMAEAFARCDHQPAQRRDPRRHGLAGGASNRSEARHRYQARDAGRCGRDRRKRLPALDRECKACGCQGGVMGGGYANRSLIPSSAIPCSAVLHISPAFTGMARVSVPVVTISPAASGGLTGSRAKRPTK